MIRAIIFDIGGVVFRPKNFHPLAKEYAKIMKREESEVYAVFVRNWHIWKFGKITEDEFFGNILKELRVEIDREKLREIMHSFPKTDKGVTSLIERLRKRYEIFALSNHTREFFDFLYRKYRLNRMFKRIFTSCETGLAKPDPRFFGCMLRETGMKPGECVFVDDREENVRAARSLGMKAVLFSDSGQLERELRELGVNF